MANLNRQPINFVMNNEMKIIRVAQGFYWIGGIIIMIGILIN